MALPGFGRSRAISRHPPAFAGIGNPCSPLVAMAVGEEELAEQWGSRKEGWRDRSLQGFVRERRGSSTLIFLVAPGLDSKRKLQRFYKQEEQQLKKQNKNPQHQNTSEKKAENRGRCVMK